MSAPERVLFAGELVTVGEFICPPHHAAFPGGRVESHLIAFPRQAVKIEREKLQPMVADATCAVTYQPDTAYRRYEIDARGDWCNYFAFDDVAATQESTEAFWRAPATVPPNAYLEQRRIVDLLACGEYDPVEVEERAVHVLRSVARDHYGGSGRTPGGPAHVGLAVDASHFLAENFRDKVDLASIGRAVGSSPFHLARVFRAVTGSTLHRRLRSLRLRAALEELRDPSADIATVAVELGFSSHSHLTRSFGAEYGCSPSAYRAEVARIRTIMQAAGR